MQLSGQSLGFQHCDMLGVTATLPQILAGRIYCPCIVLLDPQSQGPVLVTAVFLCNRKHNELSSGDQLPYHARDR